MWVLLCRVNSELWLKAFPHTRHTWGFSPVWILLCWLRPALWLKTPTLTTFIVLLFGMDCLVFSKERDLMKTFLTETTFTGLLSCAFTHVWLLSCVFSHVSGRNFGEFPTHVTFESCLSSVDPVAVSQRLDLYGFSPVWIILCHLRLKQLLKTFLHRGHSPAFPLVWIGPCASRNDPWLRDFPHCLQTCFLLKWTDECWGEDLEANSSLKLVHPAGSPCWWETCFGKGDMRLLLVCPCPGRHSFVYMFTLEHQPVILSW